MWSGTNNGKLKNLLEASDWLEMKHMKKNISKLLKPFKILSVYGEVHSYEDLLMKSLIPIPLTECGRGSKDLGDI